MKIWNEEWFPCSPQRAFELARRVDRWPVLLPHYRWVRFLRGNTEDGGLVEMAARRDFGRLSWPVWWVSRMWSDPVELTVRYTHVDGITRGMEVGWKVEPAGTGSRVSIWHEWDSGPWFCGPARRAVGRSVVGPLFVHYVAGQTLRGLSRFGRKVVVL